MTTPAKEETEMGTETEAVAVEKAKSAKQAHMMMVSIYLFIPLLFVPIEPSSSITAQPAVVEENTQGMGGPRWVIIEEDEEIEEENKFKFLLENETVFPETTRAYFTGDSQPPEVRRINWMKVAETSLPVTRNIISSDFGWRVAPCKGCSSDHKGVDFVPGKGTQVTPAMDGIVTTIDFNSGYGQYVILEHIVPVGNEVQRWESVYAHLEKDSTPVEIQVGSVVKRDDIIGRVGNTGTSTGPHLHFEIRIGGEPVDPLPLIGNHQVIQVSVPGGTEIPSDLILKEGYRYELVYE